jgi:DNA-binding PucR family transcriptional regulator
VRPAGGGQLAECAIGVGCSGTGPDSIARALYELTGRAVAVEDRPEIEKFVQQWLGRLTDYDAGRGTALVWTLSVYLDHDGSYDETAAALSVHRNTLRYRLRRIREVSGHDLSAPDTWFHLQLATRAWRTLQALPG